MSRITVLVTCLCVALAACSASKRVTTTEQELLARRTQTQMFARAMKVGVMEALCKHAHKEREADGQLFVDGGTTSNIIYGGALGREGTFGATWKRLDSNQPIPQLKHWEIMNDYGVSIPRTIQEGRPEIITRSLELSIRYSTLTSLRHPFALAELTQLRGDGETEVCWTSIPDSWRPVNKGDFDGATMRSLSDLGLKLATEPGAWSTVCS